MLWDLIQRDQKTFLKCKLGFKDQQKLSRKKWRWEGGWGKNSDKLSSMNKVGVTTKSISLKHCLITSLSYLEISIIIHYIWDLSLLILSKPSPSLSSSMKPFFITPVSGAPSPLLPLFFYEPPSTHCLYHAFNFYYTLLYTVSKFLINLYHPI